MVRACLRVLKHHNVIALVDMFCYSNRYECTNKCALDSKLLDEAVEFVVKRGNSASTTRSTLRQRSISPGPDYRNELELTPCPTDSSLDPVDAGIGVGSYPKMASGGSSRHEIPIAEFLKRDEIDEAKAAIAEFYCTCDRKVPIGEVWVSLVAKSSQRVNWQKMFQVLDHRRLIVFGLVQGVIQRIHNYPFLLRDYRRTQSGADGVAFLPTFDKPSGPHYHVKHNLLEERRKLVNRATSMMDGMHCDDHLVCTLDLSLDSILELFREENVVSVFAATDM
jgi:Nitrogen permease regulator 2